MARIAGITIPSNKRVVISLTYLKGIGRSKSQEVLKKLNIDESIKVKDLSEDQIVKLRAEIEKKNRVEGDLRRDILSNIKRLIDIGSYRGTRHAKRLPGRGQRTKTNSRTVRGNVRRTMGSGKIKAQKT